MEGILYKKDSKGKIRNWIIQTTNNKILVRHGVLGGKQVEKIKYIKKGKNIGKANETTPEEQAVLEATSTWKHQKDKGYFETVEEARTKKIYLPMLAHEFKKRKKTVTYPRLGQPKLNGVRCMAKKISNTEIDFMSRGGKPWTVLQQHPMKQILLDKMEIGDVLDGEIYKHGWSLQRIVSAVKKTNLDTPELEYWVYDRAMEGTFEDRFCVIDPFGFKNHYVRIVNTEVVYQEEDVYRLHDEWVKEGFEGTIIRNKDGLYRFGFRTSDLLKYKEFIDKEFEITGFYSERQNINGVAYQCIMYNCKTKDGGEFNCRPIGSLPDRQVKYEEAMKTRNCVGKMLTVRYFELTDDTQGKGKKVPEFPSGRVIRDYE